MVGRWMLAVLLVASAASAQSVSSGVIRGKVADETGGALPGVTVSATSPALLVPHHDCEIAAVPQPFSQIAVSILR